MDTRRAVTPALSTDARLFMTGAEPGEVWPLVRDFHYSRRMAGFVHHAFAWRGPGGLLGDTGEPLAAITYSQPVSRHLPQDALELSRLVRRDDFGRPLSAFVAWTLRWLRANTERPFVLSYADTTHAHHGGIYQACGFAYVGATDRRFIGFAAEDGSFVHGRIANERLGTQSIPRVAELRPRWEAVYGEPKHLYIYPLRQRIRSILKQRGWCALPYPKPSRDPSIGRPAPSGASCEHTAGVAPVEART